MYNINNEESISRELTGAINIQEEVNGLTPEEIEIIRIRKQKRDRMVLIAAIALTLLLLAAVIAIAIISANHTFDQQNNQNQINNAKSIENNPLVNDKTVAKYDATGKIDVKFDANHTTTTQPYGANGGAIAGISPNATPAATFGAGTPDIVQHLHNSNGQVLIQNGTSVTTAAATSITPTANANYYFDINKNGVLDAADIKFTNVMEVNTWANAATPSSNFLNYSFDLSKMNINDNSINSILNSGNVLPQDTISLASNAKISFAGVDLTNYSTVKNDVISSLNNNVDTKAYQSFFETNLANKLNDNLNNLLTETNQNVSADSLNKEYTNINEYNATSKALIVDNITESTQNKNIDAAVLYTDGIKQQLDTVHTNQAALSNNYGISQSTESYSNSLQNVNTLMDSSAATGKAATVDLNFMNNSDAKSLLQTGINLSPLSGMERSTHDPLPFEGVDYSEIFNNVDKNVFTLEQQNVINNNLNAYENNTNILNSLPTKNVYQDDSIAMNNNLISVSATRSI